MLSYWKVRFLLLFIALCLLSIITTAALFDGGGRIEALDQDYIFDRAWGTTALPGEFFNPRGIAFDDNGNIYISDTQNARIQKFSPDGVFIAGCGSYGWEPGAFGEPHGITINDTGYLLVTDSGNNRIQIFSPSLEYVQSIGSYGHGVGEFDWPLGITTRPDGSILVADTNNHRIQIFSPSGSFLSSIGSEGTADGQFMYPNDVAIDGAGNIYVIDLGNNRVQVFFENGTFLRRWGGTGDASGMFNWPQALTVTDNGTVYVADSGNSRIQTFTPEGVHLSTWNYYSEENSSEFSHPGAIAAGPGDVIGICDSENHRIGIYTENGLLLNGFGIYSHGGDGEFCRPTGIAVSPDGGILVCDNGNQRIQKFSSDGAFLFRWGSHGSGDGEFTNPFGIATDANGSVFVTETDNFRVQKFSAEGTFNSIIGSYGNGPGEFNTPRGVVVSSKGELIVVDSANHRIQRFSQYSEYLGEFGSYGSGDLQFSSPIGAAIGPNGILYIADTGNSRIKRYYTNGTFISMWGVWGNQGEGELNNPHGVAVSQAGEVFVADTYNDRICIFSGEGAFLETFGSYGSQNGSFFNLHDIAVDSEGSLYVADTHNHRIQKFVSVEKPLVANFSANRTFGRAPLSVRFTDLSSGSPDAWSWDFGDSERSDLQNPVHTYRSEGIYTVRLTITNEKGNDTETKEGYVVVFGDRSSPLIVNHTHTNLSKVPLSVIKRATRSLHIAYSHTSHGSQITDGMTGLIGFPNAPYGGSVYRWNHGGTDGALDLHDYAMEGDLGNPDRISWANRTREYLAAHPETNVIVWSWCGQVSTSTEDDIELYLSLMNTIESKYPDVLFVYMTGHLDGTGVEGNLNQRNEQIRTFCRENNKVLYDFADIESYDPDGNGYLARYANDGCDYEDGGTTRNWAIDWQNSHNEGVSWYNCNAEHSQPLNANLKAYAAWWLWSGLAGWSPDLLRADFSADTHGGPAPLLVWFTDTSAGNPGIWSWDFGDGTHSTQRNPSHIYTQPGVYTVNLTVQNDNMTNTLSRENYITVVEGGSMVCAGQRHLATRMNGTVPISIVNITHADGISLYLTFNPVLASIINVTVNASISTNTTLNCTIDNATGTASFSLKRSPETFFADTAPQQVLDLLFNAHMQPGNGSIGIADATFSLNTMTYPFARVQNGTLTVHLRSDLNRNNRIDIGDVAKVAWMAAGLIPQDPEADFDGKGTVDGADAARIAYFYVGKIPTI
ncbi:PKD domain-containing protein [Methanocalculus taiwanensis]|uniref:PKD domain-containing protein n=1 Tax=Methanocalculus taiwanensis TaxID=106207 RepID=A0ABD4THN7_9EURY|nr:PKD domain-containing protein [Methanocalculus taiwanensis]MCQ1537458.1 PKD domain-containing protein [Methanocalculus taiwanensis]